MKASIIDLKVCDLPSENIIEIRESKLILEENYLNYKVDLDLETLIDEEDPVLGYSEVRRRLWNIFIRKEKISSVGLSLTNDDFFQLVIYTVEIDIKIYFTLEDEDYAKDIYRMLFRYVTGPTSDLH